jgi:hypothetical protein
MYCITHAGACCIAVLIFVLMVVSMPSKPASNASAALMPCCASCSSEPGVEMTGCSSSHHPWLCNLPMQPTTSNVVKTSHFNLNIDFVTKRVDHQKQNGIANFSVAPYCLRHATRISKMLEIE